MFTGIQTITIPVKKELVFKIAATYPTFVQFFERRSRILSKTDSEMSVEVHTKLFGFLRTKWEGKGYIDSNREIRFEQTEGLFKGLNALWTFNEDNRGTHVSIKTTFTKQLPLFIEAWLGKNVVEKTTKKILIELKNASVSKMI